MTQPSPSRHFHLRAAGTALLLLLSLPAHAAWSDPSSWREIETKYIFGFTSGSGIGLQGEKEVSIDTVARFGKRNGSYTATETKLEFETTPTQFVQVEFGALAATHDIGGVTGLADRHEIAFNGVFAELRYLVLERSAAQPFAVTASIEPAWHRIGGNSGKHVTEYELELKLAADTQLVENQVYLGFNLLYEPEWERELGGPFEGEATLGLSTALAYRLAETFLVGAEVDYLRHYDGAGLKTFTGDAVFVGPTLFWQITGKTFVAGAFGVQVAGQDVEDPRALNLAEFSRYRAKLKAGWEF